MGGGGNSESRYKVRIISYNDALKRVARRTTEGAQRFSTKTVPRPSAPQEKRPLSVEFKGRINTQRNHFALSIDRSWPRLSSFRVLVVFRSIKEYSTRFTININ